MDRRLFLGSGLALMATRARALAPDLKVKLEALEKDEGGRIGVAVLDTRTDSLFWWRGQERFPMCSTFKVLLAAHILARVDTGAEQIDRALPVTEADILPYAPFAKTRIGATATVGELCKAAVTISDNSAANILLGASGGPKGVTAFVRKMGDRMTRLDRTEPTLNEATPGDPRDTTTPVAMLALMNRILLGATLTMPSRQLLVDWMVACETGKTKLRAGLPATWRVADKTGSGEHGSDNDIALLWPPGGKPLIVTSYLTGKDRPSAQAAAIHARIGKLISGG